jgi:CspA family cold shock protein
MSQQERFTGCVKWFNAVKGFGFIGTTEKTTNWPKKLEEDVFVHYTGISDSGYKKLNEGDVVEFSVEEGNNHRLQAVQVVNLSDDKAKSTNEQRTN